jgi:hypothetical protein
MLPGQTFQAVAKCLGPRGAGAALNCRASARDQVPDDRNHGKDQKQVDQAAGDVKGREPKNPHYEENDTDKQQHVCTPKAIFIKAFSFTAC